MAAKGDTGAGGAVAYYGSFYDNSDQPLASLTAGQAVTIGSTDVASGISITSSSRVLFANAGTYSIIFSLQLTNVSSAVEQANVWIRKNGSDLSNTNTRYDVPDKKSATIPGHTVVALNFVLDLNSNDYIEVYWAGTSLDLKLENYASGSSPTFPVTPSVILTATQVMYSAALSWEGTWNSATAYTVDQVVEYNGSSYISIQAGTNKQPDTQTTYWSLLAAKGSTGATGPGVATGGTAGQYLQKNSSTNYDTTWATFALVDADIASSAAIAYSKLNLASSIVNADVASGAAIAYSKLNLASSIVNADVATGAAIAYSKLSLSGSIVNADVSASAAIAWSKISKTSSSLADLATRTTANLTDFPSQTSNANKALVTSGSALSWGYPMGCFVIACSDETTAITTGTAKVTFRAPFAFTLPQIPRASLSTASTSGNPAIDINEGGVSIFSTTLTIDANEKTSTTAATPAVLSDTSIADDAEITIDIDTAGTGAKGLKVYIYYVRS